MSSDVPRTPYPRDAALAEESQRAGADYAGWGRRAAALLVDVLVLMVFFAALFGIAAASDPSFLDATAADPAADDDVGAGWVVFVAGAIFGPALYSWLMIGARGQTLGKMALRIRVIRADGVNRVGYARALGRVASVWLLSIVYIPIILSYLWPLWDSRNQTLHDKMASTVVVRT